ncbi:hypothetical protein ACFSX5_01085 [Devosia albogilva]|uniref:Uncharacterized protein n=1 Tax=Devosia albogilva TaxID=429726 RepID=A0ABW5QEZ9_9HYPH
MALVTPDSVFRRYVTAGVPDSGKHEPDKSEIIQLLNLLFGVSRGGWVVAKTRAELLGVTPDKETDGGVVLNDSNASYNGYYQRDGGSWVRERGFPDTFAKVELSGSGTAQTGAVVAGVNPAGVEVFFGRATTPNTGPLTLSISGGPARQVVNLAGNPLSAGEWTGIVMFYLNEVGQYQLLIDAGAALAAAASATEAGQDADRAEAEADRAQAAADAAAGVVGAAQAPQFPTIAAAQLFDPATVPDYIRTEGRDTVSDGGGGLYAATETEPATQPKFFNANVNRWFTGTETVMDIMRFGARRLGSGTSGVIADNDMALADSKEWLHGRLVAGASPELQFGPGVYDYSQFPDIARNRAHIIGKGEVKLRFHGSGNAVVLDGKANSDAEAGPVSDGVWEMKFMGFQVEAPLSANGDGIVIKGIHESDFDIETRGARHAGLRLHWLVSSRIKYRCARNGFGWYKEAEPDYGIYVDDHDTPLYFGGGPNPDYTATSFCHIHCDLTSTPYGIFHNLSNGNMVRGTFQSHDFVGVYMGADCQDNVLFNSDMEANLDTALLCLGKHNTISNSVSLDPVVLDGAAEGNRILGGMYESIYLAPTTTGNVIETNYNRSGTSTITDNGLRNSIARSFDVVTKQFRSRTKQTLSIMPSGTVYTYQNQYGDPVVLGLSGGTVEGIAINGEGIAPPSVGGGQYILPPGATAQWDASAAPTAKVWGL